MITLPTLSELKAAILASLEAEFEATINEEGKTMLGPIADNQAARLRGYYLAIAQLQKNIFVDTCDEETLLRFGDVKLGRLPFAAVAGRYTIEVTGSVSAVIPARTIFKSDDDALNPGILYILDEAYMLVSTTDTITVRCLTLGTGGKLNLLDTLSATAPIPNVNKEATVTVETVQPLAGEELEDYRAKILNAFRLEAQGGSASDYRIWASDAQGVQKVYPYAKSGATGEVDLFIEATAADSTDGKGTPSAQIILDVEAVVEQNPDTTLELNERGRRPLQVIVNYLAVTVKDIAITVTGLQDSTAEIEEDLLEAFTAAIAAIRPFVASADILADRNDTLDNNKLIGVIIATKPGAIFTSVSFTVDGVTYSTYNFTQGNIPYCNQTVTFN